MFISDSLVAPRSTCVETPGVDATGFALAFGAGGGGGAAGTTPGVK